MTEAVFDFKDIKRRMDRKPEPIAIEIVGGPSPVCTKPNCKICSPAPVTVPLALASALDWTQELTKLWDYLDDNETVFVGWDIGMIEK